MMLKAKLNEAKCRGCGCCVRSCPMGAIALGAEKAEIGEACVGCGCCVKACPFEALHLEIK